MNARRSSPELRSSLAVVGGFIRPRDNAAHGTLHASHGMCQAIATSGRYRQVHVYQEDLRHLGNQLSLSLPREPPTRVFDKSELASTDQRYTAIYVANGEQIASAPFLLRPRGDWAPLICSVGTTHIGAQWTHLLVALASGAVRETDGFVFKSIAARRLFREVWTDWQERLGFATAFPEASTVITNGVDVETHRRSDKLRQETRDRLRLNDDEPMFLSFNRLSPGTKGDHQALVVRWRDVLARVPRAVLVLAGATVDRNFLADLRVTARAAGVGDRLIIIDNPYDVMPDARGRLMSAADVLVHLTTGVEEASSLVVHEAMAHGLPVLCTDWAGLAEVVTDGESGFCVKTRVAPASVEASDTLFGTMDVAHALRLSRLVSCDWEAVVARAAVLADPDVRRRMGAAARQTAEGRTLKNAAAAYVAFFDLVSGQAEAAWSRARPLRPLIQADRVLRAQASESWSPEREVVLADATRVDLLTAGAGAERRERIAALMMTLTGRRRASLQTLAGALAQASGAPRDGDGALQAAAPLLTRMLNYGVLAWAD